MKLSDVKNFINGYYNYFRNYLDNENLPVHIREQALYRAMLCQDCLNEGKCKICGCATPAMFFAEGKEDSEDKWGPMLEAEPWEVFKDINNIKLISNFEEIMFDEIKKRYNFRFISPEMFTYRGANYYNKMNPAFLMILDELFDRYSDFADDLKIVVGYPAYETDPSRTTVLNVKECARGYWTLTRLCVELGLSFKIDKFGFTVKMESEPRYLGQDE